MVLSQSERISQLLDNSRKYVSRNKVRDSSELTLIHQAKASSSTVPAIVQGLANPHTSQLVPNYQYANDCAAVTYFTGVGTKDQTALLYNKQKCAICADDDPAVNPYIILPTPNCANVIPVLKPDYGGSLFFDGVGGDYLEIPHSADFTLGLTEDFTIEWFQYMEDNNNNAARIFSIGPFAETIGLSIEYNIGILDPYYDVFFWLDNVTPYISTTLSTTQLLNKWNHIAIDRHAGRTEIFFNGAYLAYTDGNYTVTNPSNYNLNIGQVQDAPGSTGTYKGCITNFRWTKGISLYESTDFTVPTKPLTASANTVLLLDVSSPATETQDTSGLAHSVTNHGIVYNARTPF